MEIKEAMEILEKDIHTDVPKAAISAKKHDAAVRMALVALKKHIPVKPIILDTLNGDIDYVCPLCGKEVMSDEESRNNYCGECGCKFDWRCLRAIAWMTLPNPPEEQLEYLKQWQERKKQKSKKANVFRKILRKWKRR